MKPRMFIMFVVVVSLALMLTVSTAAQRPGPSTEQPSASDGDVAISHAFSSGELESQNVNVPNVAIGQPGLSFRYVQTFGTVEVAYFDDSSHLNAPAGVGTDGTNVWIAECDGVRALKYTSTGAFIMQIGKAGFRYGASGTSLDCVEDVAVDGAGNIWAVDSGSHHVVKFNSSGNRVSELGVAWSSGTANNRFNQPYSIAFDNANNIYVSDSNNHRIQVFNSSGTCTATIGVTGVSGADNAHFNSPAHIAIDSNNLLYVADANNHRVQILNVSNLSAIAYVATLGVSGVSGSDNAHFNSPQGVAVDVTRGRIFVADANNHRVQVFNYTTRAYSSTLSGFSYTADVAVDSVGNLYVAEPWSNPTRVQQFNSSLVYVRTYGTADVPYLTDGYHFFQPAGVAVAPDGSIYIGESRGRRLIKLNAAGVPQWIKGEPGIWGSDNNHFTYVEGVALDSAGRVYAVDRSNCRVQIYNPDGSYYATLGTGRGSGSYQFNDPYGVAVDKNGNIYVADLNNHRVQIYDSSRTYVATLGQTGVSGTDNAHFNGPYDVAVDSAGNIYVVDQNNHRVQVFDSSRAYVRTIGVTGVSGSDFGHFSYPTAVAVDATGRTYVADQWGGRVQAFDNSSAYLTTVGGSSGNRTGQMRQVEGLAIDSTGNIYAADLLDHRIQKYAPSVLGWVQTNVNGFGDRLNRTVSALAPFGGQLYAGTYNPGSGNGAQLWRATDGSSWTAVMTNGFGITRNVAIDHLFPFDNQLYAGTWSTTSNGGEMWRSDSGVNWTRVVSQGFGDQTNGEIFRFAAFSDTLYASTWSYTNTHGSEVWRSSTGDVGDWTRVVTNGFGDANNSAIVSFEAFNGYLYAGTYNWNSTTMTTTGSQVWRTTNGISWTPINTDGFGTVNNAIVFALAAFNGHLYASTAPPTGAQVWRCQVCDNSDWQKVADNGFGNTNTNGPNALEVFDSHLYLVMYNYQTGMEVWRTGDGTNWEQVGFAGFGDSNNIYSYYDNAVAAFNNRLYIGTYNSANGGEIWKKTVTADFSGSPTSGPPPLTVVFTNTSAGDYTTAQWNFGNGQSFVGTALQPPVQTYTRTGNYTVTLTVGDGVDTSAITRTNYVQVWYKVYLPVTMRNYDPLLYDDFNNPTFDGSYNPAKWTFNNGGFFHARQQNGNLVFSNTITTTIGGADLIMTGQRFLPQLRQFEGRLKISSDRSGGWSSVQLFIQSDNINGHGWFTQCFLGGGPGDTTATFSCDVAFQSGSSWPREYSIPSVSVNYDTWYTIKIEADPATANLRYYLNGVLVGNHVPNDATALIAATNLRPSISVYNGDPNAFSTRYVDDVRITQP